MSQPAQSTFHAPGASHFFIADVQAGIGPSVGVVLPDRGWGPGLIDASVVMLPVIATATSCGYHGPLLARRGQVSAPATCSPRHAAA